MNSIFTGQVAVQRQIDIIANNLANMNTTGFRAERALFEKALNNQQGLLPLPLEKDIADPVVLETQSFVAVKGSYTDFSTAPTETTGNALDVAIDGEGFFVVNTPEGPRYTRAGNFKIDETGTLKTQDGFEVQGSSGSLSAKGKDIRISTAGELLADGASVGTLRVVKLEGGQFTREPGQRFAPGEGAIVTDTESPRFIAGALEGSNVNAVRELVDMIQAFRTYEALQRSSKASGDMSEQRNQTLGSLRG